MRSSRERPRESPRQRSEAGMLRYARFFDSYTHRPDVEVSFYDNAFSSSCKLINLGHMGWS